jgi:hypothetical protein
MPERQRGVPELCVYCGRQTYVPGYGCTCGTATVEDVTATLLSKRQEDR